MDSDPLFDRSTGKFWGANPIGEVSREDIEKWVQKARADGASYLMLINENDISEVYPRQVYSEQELNRRAASIDMSCRLVGVIDLSQDIDTQLAYTSDA